MFTLQDIIDALESRRHPGVTTHPDDARQLAQNDLLDDLIEEFSTPV